MQKKAFKLLLKSESLIFYIHKREVLQLTNDVLYSVSENGVATITLNRSKAMNSLSLEMLEVIGQKLEDWEADNQVRLIVMKGSGEKGFCAGGDIKTLYEAQSNQMALEKAERFFEVEYKVDQCIYQYAKPIIACLDGVVMGGGVGLTYGASYRIVTDRTKWAMPEMNIGFFPDVGAAYFLNKAPGYTGRYLALTASVIQASDVMYINGADTYMKNDHLEAFLLHVEKTNWHNNDVDTILKQLVSQFCELPPNASKLAAYQEDIHYHFSFETIEDIVKSLEDKSCDWATKTKETLLSKSPFSLKITLKQLIEGENKTREECFATDLVLATNFMNHHDFFEGVRATLIDKDHNPHYQYQHLSDVSKATVQRFWKHRDGSRASSL